MASEQVLSALEISQNKATLVTGEFLNSRLNILKTDSVEIEGVNNGYIVNQRDVCRGLHELIDNSSKLLGVAIKKVILLIPDFAIKRISKKVTVQVLDNDKKIKAKDIKLAIKEASASIKEEDRVLINVIAHSYYVNEVPYSEVPLGETADILAVGVDLFYADRNVAYQYVMACEKVGLSIIDICLSSYTAGKEMSFFTQDEEQLSVGINLQEGYTTFGLFNGNRLIGIETSNKGYGLWLNAIVENTKLEYDKARKLCNESLQIGDYDNDSTVWYETGEKSNLTIKQGDLNKIISKPLEEWLSEVTTLCGPIAERGQVVYYLYGEACDIAGLLPVLERQLKAKVNLYVPTTIGARKSEMTALLGAFYVYRDQAYLQDKPVSSIDIDAFNRMIANSYIKPAQNITKKLKNLFFEK